MATMANESEIQLLSLLVTMKALIAHFTQVSETVLTLL
jgi:hypothetical protein